MQLEFYFGSLSTAEVALAYCDGTSVIEGVKQARARKVIATQLYWEEFGKLGVGPVTGRPHAGERSYALTGAVHSRHDHPHYGSGCASLAAGLLPGRDYYRASQ